MVEFGGLDIMVSNAGTDSAPIEDASLALWTRNTDVGPCGEGLCWL